MSIYGNVSAEGGFDQAEIDFVTNLISSGQVTPEQVSAQFGVPVDVINSVYAENVARLPSPAPAPVAPAAVAPTMLTPAAPAIAPAPVETSTTDQTLGIINTIQQANTLANAAKDIYSGLTTTAPAAAANVPYQSPYAINLGGSDAAVIADPTATFTGGLSSAVGALSGQESTSESAALAVLSAFNPAAALAYRIFDAMDLFGGGGLKETPMTPEEAATYAANSRLATTLQGEGEGAGELILDAVEQAKAANVEPEKIAETLNSSDNPVAGLINLTVGSNQMLDDASLAAAQEAADTAVDTTAVDDTLTTDSTAPDYSGLETLTGGSLSDAAANAVQGPMQDANVAQGGSTAATDDVLETWTYNADTDSFISNTRGDSIPRTGDPDVALKDGGEYAIRPVIGTGGVTAEHVVDAETGKSVGEFTIDVLTGLPTLNKLPTGAATSAKDTTGAADGDVNIVGSVGDTNTASVDDGGGVTLTGGSINGQDVVLGPSVTNTDQVTTLTGGSITNNNVVNGTDGKDGKDGGQGVAGADGTDGRDGTDGKDGKDGINYGMLGTPLASSIFKTEFKMDYLKPEFIGLLDLARGRR